MRQSDPTKGSGKRPENAASGIKGCDAVWPYDPTAAYFGMKEWAELLLAERDALREALEAICQTNDSGPWIAVYRHAGGGYEGLQAIAEVALENPE